MRRRRELAVWLGARRRPRPAHPPAPGRKPDARCSPGEYRTALLIAHWGSLGLRATLLSDVAWEPDDRPARVALFTADVLALTGLLADVASTPASSRTDLADHSNGDRAG
ncbi:MAG: hypothetical protein U0163_14245 [Gemmatimonadaceae bacterium]